MRRCMCMLFFMMLLGLPVCVCAQDTITAAVAANFIKPFEEISILFEQETGIKVEATFTSTGKLYAQIVKGAPYDVFLAADEKRPALLFSDQLSEEPFVYARGKVVLWSLDKKLCEGKDWKQVVSDVKIAKIAVANTESAPYGTVAMIAMQEAGLWEQLQDRFVFPQTIAQVFQYASTGNVDVGFCALSSAVTEEGKKGCWLEVEEAPEVIQASCILKRSGKLPEAKKFTAFLLSDKAAEVKQRYGYR